jgi:hypothetical protein
MTASTANDLVLEQYGQFVKLTSGGLDVLKDNGTVVNESIFRQQAK